MKVRIRENPMGSLDFWFYIDRDNGEVDVAEPVDFKFKRREQGKGAKPTFSLDLFGFGGGSQFIRSICKELSELGAKSEDDSRLQGKLEATLKHLEDMRLLAGVKGKGGKDNADDKE